MPITREIGFLKYSAYLVKCLKKLGKKLTTLRRARITVSSLTCYIEQSLKECEKIKRSDAELAEFTNPEINSPIVPLHPQEYFIAKSKSIQKYNS